MCLPRKRFMKMSDPEIPSKKIRLDESFSGNDQNFVGNDDLWGQEELTAEEFDFLEIQATQIANPVVSSGNRSTTNRTKCAASQEEFMKQQYALEGKIKLLSDSLDKTVRELNIERLNREQILAQKTEEFRDRRCELEKEIEKLQTDLQFKEQEMKVSQNKVHILEQKFKELSKDFSQQPNDSSNKRSPNKFLNRFQFTKNDATTTDSSAQTVEKATDPSEYKLKLLSPEGELNAHEVVSSFLVNRMQSSSRTDIKSQYHLSSENSPEPPYVAFAHLNIGRVTHELWQYFSDTLEQHVSFLQKLASLSHGKNSQFLKKVKMSPAECGSLLPSTVQQLSLGDEIERQHNTVTACLKDLRLCLPFESQNLCTNVQERNEQVFKFFTESEQGACSNPLFVDEEKMDTSSQPPSCLLSVISLTKPDSYPEYYDYKKDEIGLALLVLIEWSSQKPMSLDPVIYTIPLHTLVCGSYGPRCAHFTLKLLLNLVPLKSFETLVHHNGNCLFASVADLCQSISSTIGKEYAQIVSSIQRFLGETLAVLGTTVINGENCSCSSQLVQGYIIMLWRYHHMCCNTTGASVLQMNVLKQGVVLLHQLYTKTKDFRDKRLPVEDQYVILICGFSRLSKKEAKFKNLLDIIHDLWDFQDYNSDEHDDHTAD